MIVEQTWSYPSAAQYLPKDLSVIKISRFLARYIWSWMLWLVRRPWMKRIQSTSTLLLPKPMRARGLYAMKRQNAFARRHGLNWLTGVVAFFLVTVGTAWTYQAAVSAVESGIFNPPANMVAEFPQSQ
jgi:hypothetical protein